MEASLRVMANCTGCIKQRIFILRSKSSRLAVKTLVEVTALLKESARKVHDPPGKLDDGQYQAIEEFQHSSLIVINIRVGSIDYL